MMPSSVPWEVRWSHMIRFLASVEVMTPTILAIAADILPARVRPHLARWVRRNMVTCEPIPAPATETLDEPIMVRATEWVRQATPATISAAGVRSYYGRRGAGCLAAVAHTLGVSWWAACMVRDTPWPTHTGAWTFVREPIIADCPAVRPDGWLDLMLPPPHPDAPPRRCSLVLEWDRATTPITPTFARKVRGYREWYTTLRDRDDSAPLPTIVIVVDSDHRLPPYPGSHPPWLATHGVPSGRLRRLLDIWSCWHDLWPDPWAPIWFGLPETVGLLRPAHYWTYSDLRAWTSTRWFERTTRHPPRPWPSLVTAP